MISLIATANPEITTAGFRHPETSGYIYAYGMGTPYQIISWVFHSAADVHGCIDARVVAPLRSACGAMWIGVRAPPSTLSTSLILLVDCMHRPDVRRSF